MAAHINFIHFTDVHFGLDGHEWLWPKLKNDLHRDLRQLFPITGPWDFVLFTGDFAQKGSEKEFDVAARELEELWRVFKELGCQPLLFTVPGNHDLVRLESKKHEAVALRQWWKDPVARREFWKDPAYGAHATVKSMFANYLAFLQKLQAPQPTRQAGLLPGDYSSVFSKDGIDIGLIGLNTTFLQYDSGDFRGLLDCHVAQLNPVCGNDPAKWTGSKNLNLLLTHQPPNWLEPEAQKHFRAEINPPGRFFAHYCGHQHEATSYDLAEGGSEPRRLRLGPSLFGLEKFEGATPEPQSRVQGYNLCRISLGSSKSEERFWPRTTVQGKDGSLRIRPDQSYELDEDHSVAKEFAYHGPAPRDPAPAKVSPVPTSAGSAPPPAPASSESELLQGILLHVDLADSCRQANRQGAVRTDKFTAWLGQELRKRCEPRGFRFVKPIGDAFLFFGTTVLELPQLVIDLFSNWPPREAGGFRVALRAVADSDYFLFRKDGQTLLDTVGPSTNSVFRLDKEGSEGQLLVTARLRSPICHLFQDLGIVATKTRVGPFKGFEEEGSLTVHLLQPPDSNKEMEGALPQTYLNRRAWLRDEVAFIRVLGGIAADLPMERDFINLTLDDDSGSFGHLDQQKRFPVRSGEKPEGKRSLTLAGHKNWVMACAFSPDGKTVLSGSAGHSLKLWETASGKELRTLAGHKGPVAACAFSPDGKTVLSGSYDQSLKLWETASGKELRTLAGHKDRVMACAFSPDGKTVLSGSADQSLKLWETATGREIKTVQLTWIPCQIRFSPKAVGVCVAANANGTLTLFDFTRDPELKAWFPAAKA